MAQKGKSQADKRRDMNLTDQFGRKWLAAIEKESFEPAGHVTPAGWTDPLRTPSQYLLIPRDNHGNPQINRCEVDFGRWIADQDQATRDWKIRLWQIGREQQKNAFDPKTAEQDEYLLHLTGPKPWPTPPVLRKAKAGDKRLLGILPLDRHTRILLGLVELEDLEAMAGEEFETSGEPTEKQIEKELEGAEQEGRPAFNTGDYKGFIAACLKRRIPMEKANQLWRDLRAATADKEG